MWNKTSIHIIKLAVIIFTISFMSCNTTRIVKPLKTKEFTVGLDFGGPLIDFSSLVIPVPFSSATVGYGIDTSMTVFGSFQITSAVFGTIHWDIGLLREVYKSKKAYLPSISLAASTQMMVDVFEANFRLYPVIDANFYWHYWKGKQHYFYFNWSSWFDFWTKAHNQPKNRAYYPSFALGHTFENKKMRYTIEAKYIDPFSSNQGVPVQFNGIGGMGSWGVYLSIFRKF